MSDLHPSQSFLAQHYRRYMESDEDRKHGVEGKHRMYCIFNDIDDDIASKLEKWRRDGYPKLSSRNST